MAKLNKDLAKKVDEQESSSFEALPAGPYVAKLNKVTVSPNPGKSGHHYWTWEFEVVAGEKKGRRLWMNTSLSPNALFKMKEVFDAFGYTSDSDTDEMVGEKVKLIVDTEVQTEGANKGQLRNNVLRALAVEDGDVDEEDAGGESPAY